MSKNGNGNGGTKGGTEPEPRYVTLSSLFSTGAWAMDEAEREKVVQALSKPVAQAKPGELGQEEPITFWEEALAVLFLFVFLGAMCVRARSMGCDGAWRSAGTGTGRVKQEECVRLTLIPGLSLFPYRPRLLNQ